MELTTTRFLLREFAAEDAHSPQWIQARGWHEIEWRLTKETWQSRAANQLEAGHVRNQAAPLEEEG